MIREDTWVYTCCEMCPGGCGIMAHRVDGVIVKIEGDPNCPASRGKICARGHAGLMTLYDPNRIKRPMKRSNPDKGISIDPGWVPISWDEAMNILVEKLSEVRKDDPRKLVISTFHAKVMSDVLPAWSAVFGSTNPRWGGYFCGQYLHSSMFLTNGTFHCDYDADHCDYLMLFGNQSGFGAGLTPNIAMQKVAAARSRGMKVVVMDPICSNAGSKADEWVPIRPGTDGALILAMVNVLLNELGIYDKTFLKKFTNGPYLVRPDGLYARENDKPLVWDINEGEVKPYDAEEKDCALEGSYKCGDIQCKTAFQLLKEHVKKYAPEMASEITTVPVSTIRRLAAEFGQAARIGSSIMIEGYEFPYRPAAANIYRGAGAHKHGVSVALAIQILNLMVGAFYVPGGHRGMNLIGPSWSWEPGDFNGLITPPVGGHHKAEYYHFKDKTPDTTGLEELFPLSTNLSPMCLETSLNPEKYKLPFKPEALIVCRRNLFLGGVNRETVEKSLKNFKFIAYFGTEMNEVADFADLVLPDTTYLEKLHALPNSLVWSQSAQTGYFFQGVQQPVVSPLFESRDWGDVLLEVAERMGFLEEIYKLLNKNYKLKEPYLLEPYRKYTQEEIADLRYKSEFGEEKGLEWFKNNGYLSVKRKADELYPLPRLRARFPVYYENYLLAGQKVGAIAKRMGLDNWNLSDYEPLPEWKPCNAYSEKGKYDLFVSTFRIPTHSFSWTAENAWLCEVAERNPYAQKILINTETARGKGIKDGDKVCVESSAGKVAGEAKVTECIHPETIGIASHFGSWAAGKPIARGKGVSFNALLPFSLDNIDPVSSGIDTCVKVKVYKA